jgi:hypothetical protein
MVGDDPSLSKDAIREPTLAIEDRNVMIVAVSPASGD